MRGARVIVGVSMVLGLVGCPKGPEGGGGDGGTTCAEGFVALDCGVCVPDLADCANGEVPVLGGTCRAVGVPAEGCAPGFDHDGAGSCIPVLPDAPCEGATRALPGEATCQPVMDCGTGTWGNLVRDGSTLHVDQSFVGVSDGSESAPYTTIAAAITTSTAGATIVVAEGVYKEDVLIDNGQSLRGRCPDKVILQGVNAGFPAVRIVQSNDSALSGVSVTGPFVGIGIVGGSGVVLEDLVVAAPSLVGIQAAAADASTTATMTNVVVDGASDTGIYVNGATVTVRDSVVRNMLPNPQGQYGVGYWIDDRNGAIGNLDLANSTIRNVRSNAVAALGTKATLDAVAVLGVKASRDVNGQWVAFGLQAQLGYDNVTPGYMTITRSFVKDCEYSGVSGYLGRIDMSDTAVHDTATDPDGEGGFGIVAQAKTELTVNRSLVVRSHMAGVAVTDSQATLNDLVIRDTRPRPRDLFLGTGAVFQDASVVEASGLAIEEATTMGLLLNGSNLSLTASVVRDSRPDSEGVWGNGIVLQGDSPDQRTSIANVTETLVDGAFGNGIYVTGAVATVERSVVKNVLANPATNDFGDGIAVALLYNLTPPGYLDGALTLRDTYVTGARRAGIGVFGASLNMARTVADNNAFDLAVEPMAGDRLGTNPGALPSTIADQGQNVCGCDPDVACRAESNGLAPAPQPEGFVF